MARTAFTPFGPDTYDWDATVTGYKGAPVVYKAAVAGTATNPAGTSADVILGVLGTDIGPAAPNQAVSMTATTVAEYGRVAMYAKGAINSGQVVKIGPTISTTPAGYSAAITVYTAIVATQAIAGAQPFPVLGIAESNASADGDIVYVKLAKGMYY